jgi:hypothetical protein
MSLKPPAQPGAVVVIFTTGMAQLGNSPSISATASLPATKSASLESSGNIASLLSRAPELQSSGGSRCGVNG